MPTYQTQQSSQTEQQTMSQDTSSMTSSQDYQMGFQMGLQMGNQMGMGSMMSNQDMQEQLKLIQANQAARESVIQSTEAHKNAREERGVGLYYGDKSSYHNLSWRARRDYSRTKFI